MVTRNVISGGFMDNVTNDFISHPPRQPWVCPELKVLGTMNEVSVAKPGNITNDGTKPS